MALVAAVAGVLRCGERIQEGHSAGKDGRALAVSFVLAFILSQVRTLENDHGVDEIKASEVLRITLIGRLAFFISFVVALSKIGSRWLSSNQRSPSGFLPICPDTLLRFKLDDKWGKPLFLCTAFYWYSD